jgi:nucleoside-triphosphatase THEP1
MQSIPLKISDKWLKASVAGSIWAANEIILGSFLHNLRIPFTGAVMAFISVSILVSFSELWKERGIVLRAALIAALMKSISPSAIILGPMIGIMLEGTLMALGITILGRNFAGYMFGGALAVMSVLFQKVGMLLIRYGMDFIEIINNMFLYAAEQLNFSPDKGIILIIILVGVHALAGIMGALLGILNGKNALKTESINNQSRPASSGITHLFERSEKRSYSLYLLVLHLLILILGMYMINTAPIYISVPIVLLYMLFVIFKYKTAVRRLRKPAFWIWFILITFLASYFLGGEETETGFNLTGLRDGLLMNMRAILVVMSFAAISTELKNPLIKTIMYKRGASQLYQSLELAFGILPNILSELPESKTVFKKPSGTITMLIARSDNFLKQIRKQNELKSKVLILTGGIQEGKTSLLRNILASLGKHRKDIEGFLSEVIRENGIRTGYKLIPLNGEAPEVLCTTQPGSGKTVYGKFYFNNKAADLGRKILAEAEKKSAPLIIIDEIGPLEMNGKGWANNIDSLCAGTGIPMIWVVRRNLAEKAARKWNLGDTWIIDIQEDEAEEKILELVNDFLSTQSTPSSGTE